MKYFTATTTISTNPETIWQFLSDATSFPLWDPSVIRMEGILAPGAKVVAYSKVDPKRAFPATVTEFVPNRKLTLSAGMPLGLFKGVRTFTLTPKGEKHTEFTLREEFTGLLLPLIGRTLPDLNEIFRVAAAGLKAKAEATR